MAFYVRIEDLEGNIKSYFRFEDESKAYMFYDILCTTNVGKPARVKLMDSNFVVLESNQDINPFMGF
jgi:hypothetical protein